MNTLKNLTHECKKVIKKSNRLINLTGGEHIDSLFITSLKALKIKTVNDLREYSDNLVVSSRTPDIVKIIQIKIESTDDLDFLSEISGITTYYFGNFRGELVGDKCKGVETLIFDNIRHVKFNGKFDSVKNIIDKGKDNFSYEGALELDAANFYPLQNLHIEDNELKTKLTGVFSYLEKLHLTKYEGIDLQTYRFPKLQKAHFHSFTARVEGSFEQLQMLILEEPKDRIFSFMGPRDIRNFNSENYPKLQKLKISNKFRMVGTFPLLTDLHITRKNGLGDDSSYVIQSESFPSLQILDCNNSGAVVEPIGVFENLTHLIMDTPTIFYHTENIALNSGQFPNLKVLDVKTGFHEISFTIPMRELTYLFVPDNFSEEINGTMFPKLKVLDISASSANEIIGMFPQLETLDLNRSYSKEIDRVNFPEIKKISHYIYNTRIQPINNYDEYVYKYENLDKFNADEIRKLRNYVPNHNGYETSDFKTVFFTEIKFVGNFDDVEFNNIDQRDSYHIDDLYNRMNDEFFNEDNDPYGYYASDNGHDTDGYSTE